MIKNQTGNMQLILAAIIVIVGLVVGIYLVQQRTNSLPKAASPAQTYTSRTNPQSGIKNDSDLMGASSELDNTNLNSMDNELNQNNSDASNF